LQRSSGCELFKPIGQPAVVGEILAGVLVGPSVFGFVDTSEVLEVFAELALVVGLAFLFVVFIGLGGTALHRRQPKLLTVPRSAGSPLLPAVILCLALAAVAAQNGLAAIIGAFLARMMVAETKEQQPVEREIAPLRVLPTVLLRVHRALRRSGRPCRSRDDRAARRRDRSRGRNEIHRSLARRPSTWAARCCARRCGNGAAGEVGIIVAGIGNAEGVLSSQRFAVIVGMSVLATVLVPPILRALAQRGSDSPSQAG
jgi:Kef-type K+ transport system membrane component KefB